MPSILDFLSTPNPHVISMVPNGGSLSNNPNWSDITDIRTWEEFNYDALMLCYGGTLTETQEVFPEISPPLTDLEGEFWDEDSLRHFFGRTLMASVNVALQRAWSNMYPGQASIEIRAGGFAKTIETSDQQLYADWAGIQKHQKQRGSHKYRNLCPGETKVGAKWQYHNPVLTGNNWYLPLRQIQTYSANQWNVRYGYIVTEVELVVFRFRKEHIDPGLAANRTRRITSQPDHTRNISGLSDISTMSSGLSSMSISDSSFEDDGHGELGYLEAQSVPYSAHGKGVMTVKLALWFLHMLASAPGTSISLDFQYPALHSSIKRDTGHRHSSTSIVTKKEAKRGGRR